MHRLLFNYQNMPTYLNFNYKKLNIKPNFCQHEKLNVKLRSNHLFSIPMYNNNSGQQMINFKGIIYYNKLPSSILSIDSLKPPKLFKVKLKDYIMISYESF